MMYIQPNERLRLFQLYRTHKPFEVNTVLKKLPKLGWSQPDFLDEFEIAEMGRKTGNRA